MPGHRKRRQFKQTDAFTRGMVIGLKRAGWSIRQIAADTHLGASTVHRLWRRWLEQGNVAIYRNVGATRVTSARMDRRILRQAVAAPQATCTAILQHVQDTLDHSISTRTISRRLVANGLHSCRPLRRLPLTPPNRRQRLERCRARSTWMTEWHRVVFSDESRFCLSSDSRRVRVWRRRGERSNPAAIVERPTVRQRGIMVWGAIAYDSRSPLLRIQGTMTAQRYVDDVLRPVTLPYLQGVPNALYQQDNARPHTARISQQALQDVQMLPWPPYSPDLSPIEHIWDIIGRRLHALPQPRSEDELWQMVEREWRAIPQDAIRTLIDSLPRRVAACIAVRASRPFSCLFLEDTQSLHPLLTSTQQLYCRIMSSQKRKRESITIEKKKEICQLARNNPTMSKNEIGKHFSLPRTTVRDILTQAEKWENYTVGSSKRQRVGKFSDLEDALFNWFTQKRANNIIITDDLLREKAKKTWRAFGRTRKFRVQQWRFKGRFHISQRRLCGEGASISPAIIDEHLTNLNSILANSGYDPANIYNSDETGLFFQLIPDRTLAHKDENCRGVKRMKQRITVLLCCNSTETDKRRLLIIGKSAKPRCFRNFSPHFYCTYTSNSKAWMTSSIFQEWLLEFNKQLVSEGRRILLLLDNATSHCVPNDGLSNIKIHFLPPNMTASLQPLDSGIIKSFKAQYRKLQFQKMVELADAHLPTELRLDYAVRYCKMAWDSVSPDSISNCWNHTGIIRFTSTAAVEPLNYGNLLDRIRDIFAITPENLMTEREFQLVDDSQEAEMKLTDDNFLVSTVTAKEELGEDDDATVTQRLPSLREARTAAETVLLFLEHSKRATSDDVNLSADLLRRVYAISEGEKTQVVITDFFKKM
ncbi:hypothetical protein LAZ67_15002168 [Cordylochernes scorpioides]|uniref:HTH CENPB-type domain-containing protein n=1 Tax=Cordylochernes scorpioides TaxID=51811 RepID=A0ABY6L9F1_9ARAC|nr:hypothetical protein LAZ67_15002168 [Cordylochernes scorpioides]